MNIFLLSLLFRSLIMTAIVLIFLGISKLTGNSYSPKWKSFSWYVIMLGFFLPVGTMQSTPLIEVSVVPMQHTPSAQPYTAVQNTAPDLYNILFVLWLSGFLFTLAKFIFSHLKFEIAVKRNSELCTEPRIYKIISKCTNETKSSLPEIRITNLISTPMATGIFRKKLLLPACAYKDEELRWIFNHELIHLKKHDMFMKILSCGLKAVHWFNPAVYYFMKCAEKDCEEACDEAATKNCSKEERISYCLTLLRVASDNCGLQTAFSTSFFEDKESLKKRMKNVLDIERKRKLVIVTLVVTILSVLCGSLIGFAQEYSQDNDVFITETTSTIMPHVENNAEKTTEKHTTKIFSTTTVKYEEGINVLSETTTTKIYEAPENINIIKETQKPVDIE